LQPGGSDLLDELHGKDGTDSFNKINHSDSAFALLDKLEIKGYLLGNYFFFFFAVVKFSVP